MKSRIVILSALILLFCFSISNSTENYIPSGISQHIDVAQMGMGGITTTIYTNSHTLFYNPALLNRQGLEVDIINIGLGLDTDATDVLKFVDDHQDDFDDFESLSIEEQEQFFLDCSEFDNKWVGVQAAPYIGFAASHFALGGYGISYFDVKIDQGVFVPALAMKGYMDIVIGAGIGLPVNIMDRSFEVGITGRYIQRRSFLPIRINAQDVNDAEDIFDVALDSLENSTNGFGLDVGMVRSMKLEMLGRGIDLDYAVVVQDLIGSLGGYVKPNIKFGAMTHIPFADNFLLPRWDFGIEMTDFFNRQGVNFFNRINMGTEVALLGGFAKLRSGFHQGYPTWGAGLSLFIIHLDYARFTRELGTKPGQFPETTHRAQLTIGF
ncbi:MAG: hypothetical protein J7K40_02335 [candidate division Zixibacteria bacterium]|nr:hypothetical protein [candidate division Zixibacteria bacterium]